MKAYLIIAIGFLLFSVSCKKEKKTETSKPSPALTINFGYYTGLFDFKTYKVQNTLPLDSVSSHDYFGISFVETNLAANHGFTTDSGVIEFDLFTKNDVEHFHNRKNVTGNSTYTADIFGIVEFGADIVLPNKISSVAIKGNDTIEMSDAGDFVKIDYKSKYTGLMAIDSILITK